MPASITIALVALSPKVIGSRIEMPDSGPMPGSTPTRVPTRQPRNAYHSMSGCSATEKPCSRLASVLSIGRPFASELERRERQRRLQEIGEARVGETHDQHRVGAA